MKTKAIIFDFDGVIHNTFDFHREQVREYTGVHFSEDEFRDIHNGNFFANKSDHLKDTDWLGYRDRIYELQSKLEMEDKIKETILAL